MLLTVADLEKGHKFPPVQFDLSRAWVSGYVEAVGDTAISRLGSDVVPPMAIAALALHALLQHAALAPGTIHAGQEVTFHQVAHIGDELSVKANVGSRGERAGWVLMSVDLAASGPAGEVMTGRATITYPVGGPN